MPVVFWAWSILEQNTESIHLAESLTIANSPLIAVDLEKVFQPQTISHWLEAIWNTEILVFSKENPIFITSDSPWFLGRPNATQPVSAEACELPKSSTLLNNYTDKLFIQFCLYNWLMLIWTVTFPGSAAPEIDQKKLTVYSMRFCPFAERVSDRWTIQINSELGRDQNRRLFSVLSLLQTGSALVECQTRPVSGSMHVMSNILY